MFAGRVTDKEDRINRKEVLDDRSDPVLSKPLHPHIKLDCLTKNADPTFKGELHEERSRRQATVEPNNDRQIWVNLELLLGHMPIFLNTL